MNKKIIVKAYDHNYCKCDTCENIGLVTVLLFPKSEYTRESKYTQKKTTYREVWLCDNCRNTLTAGLLNLEQPERN